VTSLLERGAGWLIGYGVLLVASAVLNVVATLLSSGVLAYLLAGPANGSPSLAAAYRVVLQRIGPLVGAVLLAGVILCAVLLLALVLLVFLAAVQYMLAPAGEAPPPGVQLALWLLLCGLVLGAGGYALFAIVRWALFVQAVVLEYCGPAMALRRSAELVRGHWWSTAALLTVLLLGQAGLGVLVSAVLQGLLGPALGSLGATLAALGWTASNLVYFPLSANALTLLFVALRARAPRP
jgi:hypothetical protein